MAERKPIVAGQFYESDKLRLVDDIKKCFLGVTGSEKDATGVIVPHAGYMFSGKGAAVSYSSLSKKKTFIIFGLSHSGYESCVSTLDWETPLGVVKNDFSLSSSLGLPVDEEVHAQEHSIEVQLPFLQYLFKDFNIVPIIVSSDYLEVASKVIDAVKGLDVGFIASSDFTHYGANYGYVPFVDNVKSEMKKLDMGAIDKIVKLDSRGFLDYIDSTGATICGKYPIACLIEVCKKLGARTGEMLSYYTSGDVAGDYSNAVGYGSIKIKN